MFLLVTTITSSVDSMSLNFLEFLSQAQFIKGYRTLSECCLYRSTSVTTVGFGNKPNLFPAMIRCFI